MRRIGLLPEHISVSNLFGQCCDRQLNFLFYRNPFFEQYLTQAENPCLFYLSNYLPAESGKEYIFFSNEKEPGHFIVDAVEYSRYPVPETQERSAVDINSLTKEELFLAEVIETYGE